MICLTTGKIIHTELTLLRIFQVLFKSEYLSIHTAGTRALQLRNLPSLEVTRLKGAFNPVLFTGPDRQL